MDGEKERLVAALVLAAERLRRVADAERQSHHPDCARVAEQWAEEARNASRVSPVIGEIAEERRRQIEKEGWAPEHDDAHSDGELARAAGAYALHAAYFAAAAQEGRWSRYRLSITHPDWPWDRKWWKPKSPRHDLIRAAALIVAEIERLDRAGGR